MDGLNDTTPAPHEAAGGDRALTAAWDALGTAVGAGRDATPASLADHVSRSGDRGTVGPLLLALLAAYTDDVPDAPAQRARMAEFLTAVASGALGAALAAEHNAHHRRTLALSLIEQLPPQALLGVLAGAGEAYRQKLSRPLAALLAKLGAEADGLPEASRPAGVASFQELAAHTVERWAEGTLQTGAGTFADMFGAAEGPASTSSRAEPEPERIMAMALEAGVIGSAVWGALAQVGEDNDAIFDYLKRAPRGSQSADMIAEHLATPTRLGGLLKNEPVDFEAVDVLLRHMGSTAAERLLEELTESHSRATRRGLLDRLATLGVDVGPMVVERLDDERWFVVRNMLHLLGQLDADTSAVPLERYASHEDARVRREAILLMMKDSASATKGMLLALQDTDSTVLRAGMKAARSGFPEQAVPVLARRAVAPDFPPEYRVQSLYLLGRTNSALALEPLLRYAIGGKTLLGKPKLAQKSPELLAALRGLARSWQHDKRAAALLAQARKSADADVAGAASGTEPAGEEA
ncbi:MAG: hypothetical protein WEB88_11255 [Gemmatimonadota bacterium]